MGCRVRFSLLSLVITCLLNLHSAHASNVLLIGSSPSGLFSQGGLVQYGHNVTVGPHYDAFDGNFDLSPFDVVVLSAVYYASPDMPTSGQTALVDFVNNGGGLITGEWVTWRIGLFGSSFAVIDPILPVWTDGSYIGGAGWTDGDVIYSQVTADPIMNAGMPLSFSLDIEPAGSEIIHARPGATVFYSGDDEFGNYPSDGLVGWDVGQGRVLSFSTTLQQPVGPDYSDPYSRLISNAIYWADSPSAAVPEPSGLLMFGAGAIGMG